MTRDHQPLTIDEFMGLWRRGDADDCPNDHSPDCNNIQFTGMAFETRAGKNILPMDAGTGVPNIIKIKNFPKIANESLLVLDTSGNIYDTGSPTPLTPILSISDPNFLDFGLVPYQGRAYISPADDKHGLDFEFVYVYLGDGTPARKAAGMPPVDADGALAAANSGSAGNVEAGIHIFGVVYETDTGFLTQIGPDTLAQVTAPGSEEVDLSSIPVSPETFVTKRHIVATRAIDPTTFTGDTRGYQFFFLPDGVINNNTATTLTVSFFDSELLEDATHLLDILSEIPAGKHLTFYRSRMINSTQDQEEEQSNILVSYPGEPEAFDAVTGIIQLMTPGNQRITTCQELRDVLYIFRDAETFATQDNGDVPSSWPVTTIDQGLGCAVNGIAVSLDIGSINIDYLLLFNFSGIFLFNGSFAFPELSWKIADLLTEIDYNEIRNVEFYNDTILKRLYIIMPDLQTLLFADYSLGLDPNKIRWCPWTFDVEITSITLTNYNQLIIASKQAHA